MGGVTSSLNYMRTGQYYLNRGGPWRDFLPEVFKLSDGLFDPADRFAGRAEESESSQGYTPFEGMELTGRVKTTLLRGEVVFGDGEVVGPPRGKYLRRPYISSAGHRPRSS